MDELLDYAARACAADPLDAASLAAARRRLTVVHPLQAFSRNYFLADPQRDPRLASFNAEYCDALRARLQAAARGLPAARSACGDSDSERDEEDGCEPDDASEAPFFAAPLPPPSDEWRTVGLDRLIRFFRNPARFLLRERLGVRVPEGDEELIDDEAFLPAWPERQALAERLLPALLAGRDPAAVHELAPAGGEFPAGPLGERLLERELGVLQTYADGLRAALAPDPLPPLQAHLDFDLGGERWTLDAAFGDLRPAGLVRHRYDEARANDYVAGWIAHLALCAAAPEAAELCTEWHSRDGVYRLRHCDDARGQLAALVALYREGLMRPLPFFPKSAWAWVVNDCSRYKAEQKWRGGARPGFGECRDAAIRLAFRGLPDPLDDAFYDHAATVLQPLVAHLDDPRL